MLLLAVAALLLLASAPYLSGVSGRFVNWDDNHYIYDNGLVKELNWASAGRILAHPYYTDYSPVFLLTLAVEYRAFGGSALGFRLASVALHVVGVLLVFALLRRLMADPLAAFIGAGLFAAHPVQVESVSWITEQKNLLSLVFLLLCFLAYIRAEDPPERSGRWYALSIGMAILACFTKPSTVILPLLLALHDQCFRGGRTWDIVRRVAPFVALALAAALLGIHAQMQSNAVAPLHGGSWSANLLTMLPVYADYLRLFLLPVGLTTYRPKVIHTTLLDWRVVAGLAFVLALIAVGAILWRRSRRAFFWLAWVPVSLLPVANLIPMRILMAERYMHLPMIGLAAMGGLAVAWGFQKAQAAQARVAYGALTVAALAMLSAISFQRAFVWRDSLSLWRSTVACAPNDTVPQLNLGATYIEGATPRAEQALRAFRRVPLRADSEAGDREMLYFNMGNAYLHLSQADAALECLLEANRIAPNDAPCWYSLALAYHMKNMAVEEELALRKTIEYNPGSLQAHNNLGTLLMKSGRLQEAEEHLLKAATLDPRQPLTHYNLALLYTKMGELSKARDSLRRCLALAPPDFPKLQEARQRLQQIEQQVAP